MKRKNVSTQNRKEKNNEPRIPTINEMVAIASQMGKKLGRYVSYGEVDTAIRTGKIKL